MPEFNADQQSEAWEESPVTIGGKVFKPVRMTNAIVKKVRDLALAAQKLLAEKGDESEEVQDAGATIIHEQLSILLVDDAGKAPIKTDFAKLDQRVAVKLLQWLMEGNEPEGNSSTPGQPATPTTTA